jgi:hypothetical protein
MDPMIEAVLLPDDLEILLTDGNAGALPYGAFGSADVLREAMIADPMIAGFSETAPAQGYNRVLVKLANGEDRVMAYRKP